MRLHARALPPQVMLRAMQIETLGALLAPLSEADRLDLLAAIAPSALPRHMHRLAMVVLMHESARPEGVGQACAAALRSIDESTGESSSGNSERHTAMAHAMMDELAEL